MVKQNYKLTLAAVPRQEGFPVKVLMLFEPLKLETVTANLMHYFGSC